MRKAVRAIVVKGDTLLVMHRNKFGHEYYALVGGGIDFGETAEQSLIREITEETELSVKNRRLVFIEEAGHVFGIQYIYLCEYVSGEPKLQPDSIEAKIEADGKNLYTPMWLPIKDLQTVPLLPEILKRSLLDGLKNGWPEKPITLHAD